MNSQGVGCSDRGYLGQAKTLSLLFGFEVLNSEFWSAL